MISFCRKSHKFDKRFRLFVITNLANPYFEVNVTNHVTTVNFGVGIDSL